MRLLDMSGGSVVIVAPGAELLVQGPGTCRITGGNRGDGHSVRNFGVTRFASTKPDVVPMVHWDNTCLLHGGNASAAVLNLSNSRLRFTTWGPTPGCACRECVTLSNGTLIGGAATEIEWQHTPVAGERGVLSVGPSVNATAWLGAWTLDNVDMDNS